MRVKLVHEGEGSVVNASATDGDVVGIHHAVHEAVKKREKSDPDARWDRRATTHP